MSSQASSAGHGEKEVRRKLVETGDVDVDVMVAIRSNFFYTRTVPCELWHFDRAKPAERKGQPPTVDARAMSDGTLRFLAILTALLTRPKGSLLAIEVVDNGLHPSRAQLLLDMLKAVGPERGVDVLVATHNPALLDAMGTAMVPYITVANRDASTGYSVLTLLEDVGQLPKLLAQGPIGRLSSQGLIEQSLCNEHATRRQEQVEIVYAQARSYP